MKTQTTYRQRINAEEEEIDLVQLMLYVFRKWKLLLLACVLGALLGGAFGAMKTAKNAASTGMDEPNMTQIEQYARYQQLYKDEAARQTDSIYLNMNPEAVYTAKKSYYVSASENDLNRVGLAVNAIAQDQAVYTQMLEETGLTCSAGTLAELIDVAFQPADVNLNDQKTLKIQAPQESCSGAQIALTVNAPSEEIGEKLLAVLDERVQAVCAQIAQTAEGLTVETIAQSGMTGYCGDILTQREVSTNRLNAYLNSIATLKKNLTDNDLAYYGMIYEGKEIGEQTVKSQTLKWTLIGALALLVVAAGCYVVAFLLNGSVKSTDELEERYGLHMLARVEPEGAKKTLRGLDKLLAEKPQYNDDAYLNAALGAMGADNIILSGDLQNEQIARKMKAAAQAGNYKVCDRFAVDGQAVAQKTDGVVLFVQPWVTKNEQVLRELEICEFNEQRVLGFVAVG